MNSDALVVLVLELELLLVYEIGFENPEYLYLQHCLQLIWKLRLIMDNVSGDNEFTSCNIVTNNPLVSYSISQKTHGTDLGCNL